VLRSPLLEASTAKKDQKCVCRGTLFLSCRDGLSLVLAVLCVCQPTNNPACPCATAAPKGVQLDTSPGPMTSELGSRSHVEKYTSSNFKGAPGTLALRLRSCEGKETKEKCACLPFQPFCENKKVRWLDASLSFDIMAPLLTGQMVQARMPTGKFLIFLQGVASRIQM